MFWQTINSGDFWHHLNTGKYILENHSLPYTDTLSFTANGLPWVAHSWGAGVIFAYFFNNLGELGISFLFLFLGLLTTYFLYLSTTVIPAKDENLPAGRQVHQSKSTIHDLRSTKLILPLLGGAIISLRWPTRPEVFAPLFCSLLIVLIQRKKYLLLPLLFWLWGIIYGSSVFLGLIIYLFYILTCHSREGGNPSKEYHYGILLTSLVSSLLNGYGLSSFLYLQQIPAIAPHVGEWLSVFAALNPANSNVALFYQFPILFLIILIIILLFTLHLVIPDPSRPAGGLTRIPVPNLTFYLLLSTFIFTPFFSIRFINLYPIFVLPLLAITLNQLTPTIQTKFNIALLILTIWAFFISFSHPQQNVFPQKAVEFLKQNNLNGNILSSQENGAYISTHLPNSKIFVDTRDDLYQPTEVFSDLQKLNINQLVNKYPVNIVIADLSEYYHPLLYNPRWKLIFLSDQYFVLTSLPFANSLNAIDPLQVPPAKAGLLKEALSETAPNSDENYVRQIQLLLALQKPKEALNLLPNLHLKNRLEDNELLNLIYVNAGDCIQANVYFKRVQKQSQLKYIFTPWQSLPNLATTCP